MKRKFVYLFLLWVVIVLVMANGRSQSAAVSHAAPLALTMTASATLAHAGQAISLTGAGYVPGNYAGTVLWDGADVETFLIESGGGFERTFFIPPTASPGPHTVTVCSLYPCATGEFEQKATVVITVMPTNAFLPMVAQGHGGAIPPFTFTIDSTVQPISVTLPLWDGQPRPLAAVADPHGTVASYVANELIVQTNDTAALNAFLAQYSGTILLEIDPSTAGLAGLDNMYLVRVDTSTADLGQLTADLEALNNGTLSAASGAHRFSSTEGAQLLALASGEAQAGLSVGINWLSHTDVVPTDSNEANNGGVFGGLPYTNNAYNWHYYNRGSIQDIGTAEAWNALYYGGRWDNRVKIAILDGGFAPDSDFTAATYLNVFPFDPVNMRDVQGGWHGTHVYHTAMARAGNNFGTAGVAHTIGQPILLYTSYDFVVSIASVIMAKAAGANVINMSYSADVPAAFSWTVLPFELTTLAVRASGTLLFASAGNSNQDVDAQTCFIFCWEDTLHTPCENRGVICVGGLEWNSTNKAVSSASSGSSWGSRGGVHIFAPYRVYRGPDPDNLNNGTNVSQISGTSFSSPYVAGVAALIWAANPALSADQVWQIMRDTAHTSADTRVPRYVNAYAAVRQAMGTAGTVIVNLPANGATFQLNQNISFQATVGYVGNSPAPLTVNWSSNLDGLFFTQMFNPIAGVNGFTSQTVYTGLSVGTHIITVQAIGGGVNTSRILTVHVVNTPPTAAITSPASGSTVCQGDIVTLRGTGTDINEPSGLPNSAFAWSSNLNGNLGIGPVRPVSTLSVGLHTITLVVTDSEGATDDATISLTVLADTNPTCFNNAPSAQITAPANGYSVYADAQDGQGWYYTVNFSGLVGDAETPINNLTVTWASDVEGTFTGVTVNPSTGVTTVSARLHVRPQDVGLGLTTHTITLTVFDGEKTTVDTIVVYINLLI